MRLDLATVDHLLTTTHSVRKRLDLKREVEPAVLQRCCHFCGCRDKVLLVIGARGVDHPRNPAHLN